MTLVRLLEPEEADPAARATLDDIATRYGTVLATWRALLHRPPIFVAYVPYLRAVAGPGVVEQRTKELAALRVAIANHCRYTASHRVRAARAAGVTDDELDALAADRLDGFAERERVAIEYARELSVCPPVVGYEASPQAVDDRLLGRVREVFSDAEIVELTADICLWNALARFHRVMGFPLDMPAPPQSIEEALR
ncbi:MAG TPA: carboxymuconolactone decarboxylase family protein [Candidatus Limnocylindrales bacterium]|nr:carboxymuconolactone decarboxylase family protein [Candidatus Limnocylindrales bacterium]